MQIHITKIKLAIVAMLFTLTTKAQTWPVDTTGLQTKPWACGIDQSFWNNINLDLELSNSRMAYDTSILSKVTSTVTPSVSYTIPVVFHVISTTTLTSVLPYAQIQWQLAALNAAYQDQLVAFRGGTVGSYTTNAKIVFVLACNAEPLNGTGNNPTTGQPNGWTNTTEPGVVRYATSNPSILNQGVLDPTTYGPMLAMTNPTGYFPKTDYLNIYCVPYIASSSGGTVIGFGTFPWMTLPLDGITMRIDCIGNTSYPIGTGL